MLPRNTIRKIKLFTVNISKSLVIIYLGYKFKSTKVKMKILFAMRFTLTYTFLSKYVFGKQDKNI